MCFYKWPICNFIQKPDLQHIPERGAMCLGQKNRCFFPANSTQLRRPLSVWIQCPRDWESRYYFTILLLKVKIELIFQGILNYYADNCLTLNSKNEPCQAPHITQRPLSKLEAFNIKESLARTPSLNLFPLIQPFIIRLYQDGLKKWFWDSCFRPSISNIVSNSYK